jgi:hypothetical protein
MMDALQLQSYRQILEKNGDALDRMAHTGLRKRAHEMTDFGDHKVPAALVKKAKAYLRGPNKKVKS